MYVQEKEKNIVILPGCTNRTSKILSTWLLYAVIWKIHSGESWMHVIFTGTKSSETCCHFTVPAPLALTWNTSAHSLEILIAELYVVITRLIAFRKMISKRSTTRKENTDIKSNRKGIYRHISFDRFPTTISLQVRSFVSFVFYSSSPFLSSSFPSYFPFLFLSFFLSFFVIAFI